MAILGVGGNTSWAYVFCTLLSPFQFPLLSGNKGFKFTAAKALRCFFIHIKYYFINHDVERCMKRLHFHQNNEFHFFWKIFLARKQISQQARRFSNIWKFSKSAAHWSIISQNTVKLRALVIILLSFFCKSQSLDRSREIRSYLL